MAEYIEREKAYTLAKKICDAVNSGTRALFLGRDILDWIDDLPAADVRPVVKAAWEQVEVRYEDELIDNPVQAVASMFCPNCQRYHNEVYFYGMPTERVNYCPNCGADMRRES